MQVPVPANSTQKTLPDLHGKCILIADDEPINVMIVSKLLIAKGATVLKAHNGYETLDILETVIPDLVLLDLKMPGMNGFDTIRRIKKDYPAIVVLAFTALDIDEAEEKSLINQGFYGSLLKNFQPDTFYSTIAAAISASSQNDQ